MQDDDRVPPDDPEMYSRWVSDLMERVSRLAGRAAPAPEERGIFLSEQDLERLGKIAKRSTDAFTGVSLLALLERHHWEDQFEGAEEVRDDVVDAALKGGRLSRAQLDSMRGWFDEREDDIQQRMGEAAIREMDFSFIHSEEAGEISWGDIDPKALRDFLDGVAAEFVEYADMLMPGGQDHLDTLEVCLRRLGAYAIPDPLDRFEWFCSSVALLKNDPFSDSDLWAITEMVLRWVPGASGPQDELRRVLGALRRRRWYSVLARSYMDDYLAEVKRAVKVPAAG